MSGTIEKKGKVIGAGKPLICVPVTEETKEGILKEIKLLSEKKIDMIEWRVDYFEKAENIPAVVEVLEEVSGCLKESILLFTFRSKNQGGQLPLSSKEVFLLNEAAAKTGVPDFIDMEYFEYENQKEKIKQLQNCGVFVICSHHDFDKTPQRHIMERLLEQMKEDGADIVKLAVMPRGCQDTLELLSVTDTYVKKYPDTPVITMSMGREGLISRLCGEIFGSCVTFGAHEKASAPGQMEMEDLSVVLESIHKSIS